jgi:hypothetical protein
MDPMERAWHWWTHLIGIPFWDPWLALMVLIVAVFLIVRGVARMLRP